MAVCRTSKYDESNRRRQVSLMPRYAETLWLRGKGWAVKLMGPTGSGRWDTSSLIARLG